MKINQLKLNTIVFIALIILVIVFRLIVLVVFNFEILDSDQPIMWLGAKHYSEGQFYEPRFYGQDYSTMLESLMALPFLYSGLPLHKALPLISSILTVFPIILLARITFKKGSELTAILILSIFLALPLEYTMITGMPRGFVPGIFIASFLLISYSKNSKSAFFFNLLIASIAFSVNPNSILLSIPLLFMVFIKNYKAKDFWIFSTLGLVIGFSIHALVALFYIKNPYFNFHGHSVEYSWDYFLKGIKHFDNSIKYITPILWKNESIMLFLFLIVGIILFKRKSYHYALITFSIPFLLFLPLFNSKIHDGSDSIFFPLSRMYLAFPILLLFIISFIKLNSRLFLILSTFIAVGFTSFNLSQLQYKSNKALHDEGIFRILTYNDLKSKCELLQQISKENKVDLILISRHKYNIYYNYGCEACMTNFPKTLNPEVERRTWRLLEDDSKVYKTIIIIDSDRNLDREFNFIKKIDELDDFYLIHENVLTTSELIQKLNIPVRRFK